MSLRLKEWPKLVSFRVLVSSMGAGGRELRKTLYGVYEFAVDLSCATLVCPPPRGQIGERTFYGVDGFPGLWVAYAGKNGMSLRFVLRHHTSYMTWSRRWSLRNVLVVRRNGTKVELNEYLDIQAAARGTAHALGPNPPRLRPDTPKPTGGPKN